MNPYEVLDVPKNFTLQQLKDNYKRIALKVHPDKGGSEQLFLLVTKCFKKLIQEYHKRQADKQYHELKADFTRAAEQQPTSYANDGASPSSSSRKFDLNKFNQLFDQHRMDDPAADKGYGEWMTAAAPPHEDTVKRRTFGTNANGFSVNAFNNAFNEEARVENNNKYIIRYKEPEPLVCTKKISFTELGVDDVDDFSGENITRRTLNYMDYKIAHSTSKIVDPRMATNKSYRNVQELERDRGNLRYDMNDYEKQEYENAQRMQALKERKRQETLDAHDRQTERHYERVNRLMLDQSRRAYQ